MSVWNGHYACACYHPLFVFNQFGDLERSALRPGNVHSADGWDGVLKPVVARYQSKVSRQDRRASVSQRPGYIKTGMGPIMKLNWRRLTLVSATGPTTHWGLVF
jgi:hypothetical protein